MSEVKTFKLVRIGGANAFERGEAYGAAAGQEIANCVEMYKEHLSRLKDLNWADAREEAMRYIPLVEAALPIETDTLRGVAAGSGADFEDVMVLNTRYEMLHYPKNECTSFAVLREASRERHVYVGQNWDQRPIVTPQAVVLHVTMEDGTKIMGVTEAGQLLRNGMNSHGLGLAANGLNSAMDAKRIGIPGNFMRMRALRSKTFDEMAEFIAASHRAVANNYCIASAENRALDVEAIPELPCLIHPRDGVLTHANHLLCRPDLDTSKGKKFRGERLDELLRERAGDITVDDIKRGLSDHHGYPDSVCSHIAEGQADMHRAWMTIASIIYDLDALEMEVCRDNPCEGEYRKLRLADY